MVAGDDAHTEEDELEAGSEEGASARIIYDNSESEQGKQIKLLNFVQTATTFTDMSDDESVDEPEEVKRAWEELMIIQREQQR